MRAFILIQAVFRQSACLLLVAATASAAVGPDFYVARNGSDDNPGTIEKPFATIARARDAVRPMIATVSGNIQMFLDSKQQRK